MLGALLPVLLSPITFAATLLYIRFGPACLGWYFEGLGLLVNAVVPEGGVKGLILPLVTIVALPVVPGSVLVGVVSWRVLRSLRLALLAFAVAIIAQVIGLAILIAVLTLVG